MGQLVLIVALMIFILCVVLMVLFRSSKEQTELQVEATYEGINELGQVIMKVLFIFSVGKLSTSNKEMLAHIKWSDGWLPVSYSIKENGTYRENCLYVSDLNESFLTFPIDEVNAVDKNGAGEGYVMFTLDCPSNATKSTVAMIIDIYTSNTAYQLSNSTSWDNQFVVSN